LQHEEGQRVALTNSAIEPATDETLDLGTPTNKFKDLYLSSDSIFIGNTKLSSDPATGALSTVVADEQGQFTAPPAAVGGSSKVYDWKGTTTNIAANDPRNGEGLISVQSMESLYDRFCGSQASNNYPSTWPFEVIWGNYLGNPTTPEYPTTYRGSQPYLFSSGVYDYTSTFITDENGDDLHKFLEDYMAENNTPILNFEFSLSARLQVQDPVKAAQIPYFQQGQYNNATNVTSVPLWTIRYPFMYSFKTTPADPVWPHVRGIVTASIGSDMYGYDWGYPMHPINHAALWFLGDGQHQFGQPNVFNGNYQAGSGTHVGTMNALNIEMKFTNAGAGMLSADHANASQPGYFDLQDGIVFDMLVNIK